MNENKKRLGVITNTETGEQLEIVSAYAGRFTGGRTVSVTKTEIGSYTFSVRTPDDNGDIREQQMHISKYDFSALLRAIALFLYKEGVNLPDFIDLAIDKDSGYLYETLDDYKEETK